MKNLIITAGIIIMASAALFMTIQYQIVVHSWINLKFAADDAAEAAALCIDPEAYAEGRISFDRTEGKRLAEKITDRNLGAGKYEMRLEFADGEQARAEAVLQAGKLKRKSVYEYVKD